MRHINITYHMSNRNETAETCITLPMDNTVALRVLRDGADSVPNVRRILKYLAAIQGYEYIGGCYAEPDTAWEGRDTE